MRCSACDGSGTVEVLTERTTRSSGTTAWVGCEECGGTGERDDLAAALARAEAAERACGQTAEELHSVEGHLHVVEAERDDWHKTADRRSAGILKAEFERDTAIGERDYAREVIAKTWTALDGDGIGALFAFAQGRMELLQSALARAEAAEAKLAERTADLNDAVTCAAERGDKYRAVEAERDEAQAEVKRLRDLLEMAHHALMSMSPAPLVSLVDAISAALAPVEKP